MIFFRKKSNTGNFVKTKVNKGPQVGWGIDSSSKVSSLPEADFFSTAKSLLDLGRCNIGHRNCDVLFFGTS